MRVLECIRMSKECDASVEVLECMRLRHLMKVSGICNESAEGK